MTFLKRPLTGFLVFCLCLGLIATRVQAADIPAFDGNSETPGANPMTHAELPLDRPNIEQTALLPWVADKASEAYSLDLDSYKDSLKKASKNFTTEGWKGFTSVLARNGIIDKIEKTKMVVSIVPGTPILLSEGPREGVYTWLVTMPATITYLAAKEQHDELTTINVTVRRVPAKDNLLGIQIADWTQT